MKISKELYEELKNRLELVEKKLNGNGGGNPYHDNLGRFCEGPSKAFGDFNPTDEEVFQEISGLRGGFNVKDEDRMDNGVSISTRLENADAIDALTRSKLVADKTNGLGKAGQKAIDQASGKPEVALIAQTANWVNRHINDAQMDISTLAMQVASESQHNNTTQEDLYRKAGRNRIIDDINKSLNTATKYLDGRRKKMGIAGEAYANEAWKSVEALQAATNTLKYLSDNLSKGVMHDVFVEKPKAQKQMPKTATLDDLAGMGLIPKPQRMNSINRLKQAIEKLENGGKGSGNFGHSGRPGKVGGSGKSSASSLARGRMEKGVREYDPEKGIDGGFTVDLKDGKAYRLGKSDGYAVGGFGTEQVIDMKDWNDKQKRKKIINEYLRKNKKALSQEGACLGGWVPNKGSTNDPNIIGKVVLDVSKVFKDKKKAAIAAIKADQDSITDFKGFDWPTKEDLAKEFGLEKELKKASGKRAAERAGK